MAAGARERGRVPPAWHLDEYRAALQPVLRGQPGRGRKPRRPSGVALISTSARVLTANDHPRSKSSGDLPLSADQMCPARGDEACTLSSHREAADKRGGIDVVRTEHQDLAGVRIGRAGLLV